jgi:hypothetical protein
MWCVEAPCWLRYVRIPGVGRGSCGYVPYLSSGALDRWAPLCLLCPAPLKPRAANYRERICSISRYPDIDLM